MASLTSTQLIALTFTPSVTGSLSLLGSLVIIRKFLCYSKKKLSTPYNRIMFGLSCADIVQSATSILSTFPAPQGSAYFAYGNVTTCEIQGFLTQVSLSQAFYNASLSIYYVLFVRFGYSERKIKDKVEPFLHAISVGFLVSTAVLGLPFEVYNFSGTRCGVSPYPMNCSSDLGVDCTRGEYAVSFGRFLYLIWLVIAYAIIILSLLTMLWSLWSLEQRLERRYGVATLNVDEALTQRSRMSRKMKDLALQCFFYIGAFFLTYIWSLLYRIIKSSMGNDIFVLALCGNIFFPLQGIMNCGIYLRPDVVKLKRINPDCSYVWAIYKVAVTDISRRNSLRLQAHQQAVDMS